MHSSHMFGLGGAEILVIIMIIGLLLIFSLIPAILAFTVLNRVPAQHRTQSPGLAFLLLIPFFNLVWAFFIHPRVASSLKNYANASNDPSHGKCGEDLALWLCICTVCEVIPGIGIFTGIAALILMIIFYVKAFDISSAIARKNLWGSPPPGQTM